MNYAEFDGVDTWQITGVDTIGSLRNTSLAIAPDGFPAISYYDDGTETVKYAKFNGSIWVLNTVGSALFVPVTTLVFTPAGQPAITYEALDGSSSTGLVYAVFNGSTWDITPVDPTPTTGQFSSPGL